MNLGFSPISDVVGKLVDAPLLFAGSPKARVLDIFLRPQTLDRAGATPRHFLARLMAECPDGLLELKRRFVADWGAWPFAVVLMLVCLTFLLGAGQR